jgi:hypothetical protein
MAAAPAAVKTIAIGMIRFFMLALLWPGRTFRRAA